MRQDTRTTPEIRFIAAMRAAAGSGLGLLHSEGLSRNVRQAIGWTLLVFGAITTPAAAKIVPRRRRCIAELRFFP